MTREERESYMLTIHKLIVKHPGEMDSTALAAATGLTNGQVGRLLWHINRGSDGMGLTPVAYDGLAGGFFAATTPKHAPAFEWADMHLERCTRGAHGARLRQHERVAALPGKRWQRAGATITQGIHASRPALEAEQLEAFEEVVAD